MSGRVTKWWLTADFSSPPVKDKVKPKAKPKGKPKGKSRLGASPVENCSPSPSPPPNLSPPPERRSSKRKQKPIPIFTPSIALEAVEEPAEEAPSQQPSDQAIVPATPDSGAQSRSAAKVDDAVPLQTSPQALAKPQPKGKSAPSGTSSALANPRKRKRGPCRSSATNAESPTSLPSSTKSRKRKAEQSASTVSATPKGTKTNPKQAQQAGRRPGFLGLGCLIPHT
jgi:hypothetical protein